MDLEGKTDSPGAKHVYLNISPQLKKLPDDDLELWEAFQQDDPGAFTRIYDDFFPLLFNYGCQFTQNREIVKDLIQDLFIDLNEKKGSLGKVRNIKFYLFKSLKRRLMVMLKKQHLPYYPNFLQKVPPFAISVSHEQHIIEAEEDRGKRKALEIAYAQLSERQREVLLYYFYEGLNYEEISELMGFSKSEHARKLVYRSIVKLRDFIKSEGFTLFSISVLLLILMICSLF